MNRATVLLMAGLLLAAFTADGRAQTYSSKIITLVVPFSAGSATDGLARSVAQEMSKEAGQAVIVENKPGANGFIAAQAVARAIPDGHTVLISTNTTHAANEHLFKKLPYDPVKDYKPVTALAKGYQVLVVNPSLPVGNVAELIEHAKKNPDKLTFGHGSSSARVAVEQFQQMTGIKLRDVPYKSNPAAITDLIGGQIDMMIVDTPTGLPQVKSGKLRGLGVTSRQRSAQAPDIPTIDEAGVKGYEMSYWFAAYVPGQTPDTVVKRLHEFLVNAINTENVKKFLTNSGLEAFTTTPGELAKFQSAESEKWGKIIKAAGIQAE
jgi:tripartite-type tricarboxylate transporter receptor subunit TctC